MNNTISILILAFILSSCVKKTPDYIVISGTIKNANVNTNLSRNSDKFSICSRDKEPFCDLDVRKDGTFRDTLYLDEGHYFFYYEGKKAFLYLIPGDELNITFDIEKFNETLTYEGKRSSENNYLNQKTFKEKSFGKLSLLTLASLEESAFLDKVGNIKNEMLNFLDAYVNLSVKFKNLEQHKIEYEWVNRIDSYQDYKRYLLKDNSYTVSNSFPKIPEKFNDIENESLLNLKPYQTFIRNHYIRLSADMIEKDTLLSGDIAYFKTVNKHAKNPVVKNYLLFKRARYGINRTNELLDYYNTFIESSTNNEHKEFITEKYTRLIAKPENGTVSPLFVDYEDANGGTKSLIDFKGSYVYIDIWATWCVPCIKEVPYLKELEEDYKNKNIKFISISVDKIEAKNKWVDMIKKMNLGGVQLFADKDFGSSFIKEYAVQSIPRFILIDSKGNILDAAAPRPSNPNLRLLFEGLNI